MRSALAEGKPLEWMRPEWMTIARQIKGRDIDTAIAQGVGAVLAWLFAVEAYASSLPSKATTPSVYSSMWRGVTYYGLQIAVRRAVSKSGIVDLRLHDLRHTAATRTLRVSNLRVVQHLLGHADITTTAKYAHVQSEDIRAALDAASPTKTPTREYQHSPKSLKMNG